MDSQIETMSKRVLLLLKLDSTRLMQKIITREDQYLALLSIKRTRTHFHKIFENRYADTPIQELKFCSDASIQEINEFYNLVDDMQWYLNHTEDLPGAIKDKVDHFIKDLEKAHLGLLEIIDLELGIESEKPPEIERMVLGEEELKPNFELDEPEFDFSEPTQGEINFSSEDDSDK